VSREDIARLLGGYATGTLTPEEQQTLFAAALEDQALFDELAREQALRDVLSEPAARAQLLAALEDPPRRRWRFSDWMLRPAALTAATACLVLLGAVAVWRPWRGNEATKPDLLATALPGERRPMPSPPAVADQKELALPEARAASKVKEPSRSFTVPAAGLAATPAAKKEQLLGEGDTLAAAPRQLDAPVSPVGSTMFPAAPPPPAKSVNANGTMNLAITSRDAAEMVQGAPGVSGGAVAGTAALKGAFSANGPHTSNAVSLRSGGDARQRYYAASGFASVEAKAQTPKVEMARASESQSAPLGIKWSVLRRQPNGMFAIANAEDVRSGDTVELRLVPNQTCDVAVFDNASGRLLPLFSNHVEAGEAYDTPPLAPREPGLRELVVELTRSGSVAGGIAGAQAAAPQAAQQSETDRSERATYTVGPPDAQQVFLSITLNYR